MKQAVSGRVIGAYIAGAHTGAIAAHVDHAPIVRFDPESSGELGTGNATGHCVAGVDGKVYHLTFADL